MTSHVQAFKSLHHSEVVLEANHEDAYTSVAPMHLVISEFPNSGDFNFTQDSTITDYPWSSPSVTPWQLIISNIRRQLRSLIILHVHNVKHTLAWAIMNRGRFLCIQFYQSSGNYYDHYNKSTSANHAVIEITFVSPTSMHVDQMEYIHTFSFNENEIIFPNLRSQALNLTLRIPVILVIYIL